MDRVSLMPGECLPHDRRFAIALGTTIFDPRRPTWLPKTHFVMLMRDESLARLRTRFDAASGLLTIAEQDRVLLNEPIGTPEGSRRIAEFLENFLAGSVAGPLRAATQVNPVTAERDLDIVGTLQRYFGHNLMGVYAEAVSRGDIAVGNVLSIESITGPAPKDEN